MVAAAGVVELQQAVSSKLFRKIEFSVAPVEYNLVLSDLA